MEKMGRRELVTLNLFINTLFLLSIMIVVFKSMISIISKNYINTSKNMNVRFENRRQVRGKIAFTSPAEKTRKRNPVRVKRPAYAPTKATNRKVAGNSDYYYELLKKKYEQ